jgi:hypothetical protein
MPRFLVGLTFGVFLGAAVLAILIRVGEDRYLREARGNA